MDGSHVSDIQIRTNVLFDISISLRFSVNLVIYTMRVSTTSGTYSYRRNKTACALGAYFPQPRVLLLISVAEFHQHSNIKTDPDLSPCEMNVTSKPAVAHNKTEVNSPR